MHTWQYERLASPQGICTAYPSVLRNMAGELRVSAARRIQDVSLVPDGERCEACRVASAAEEEGVQSVAARPTEPGEEWDAPNLCLVHLQKVVERVSDTQTVRGLLSHAAEVLDQLADRMEQFNQKREKKLQAPITEEDWLAPRQALALLVGHRKVQPAKANILRASGAPRHD